MMCSAGAAAAAAAAAADEDGDAADRRGGCGLDGGVAMLAARASQPGAGLAA